MTEGRYPPTDSMCAPPMTPAEGASIRDRYMTRVLSRSDLYELVWSTPMATLAEQFSISDRGLAKTCKRHQIPVPGRGYWARLAAGQPMSKTPLWHPDNRALTPVYIGAQAPSKTVEMTLAVETAHAAVARSRSRSSAPKVSSIQHAEPLKPSLSPTTLNHFARRIFGVLTRAKVSEFGDVRTSGIHVHPNSVLRAANLISLVTEPAKARQISVFVDEDQVVAAIGSERVALCILESRKRTEHEPTQKERAELEAERKRYGIVFGKRWPKYDYHYSGELVFEIGNSASGGRRRWTDKPNKPIESLVEEIVDGIVYHLSFLKSEREQREAAELRRQHLNARRELLRLRKDREEKREHFIQQLALLRREALELRQTISLIPISPDETSELARMKLWAESRLGLLEARTDVSKINETLLRMNLFPEHDDLADPEGDLPE